MRVWETSFHPDKSRERENLAIKGNVSKDQYQSGEVIKTYQGKMGHEGFQLFIVSGISDAFPFTPIIQPGPDAKVDGEETA